MKLISTFVAALLYSVAGLLVLAGCGKKEQPTSEAHGHGSSQAASPHHHEHVAPHGGTAVVLGKELFHLELVRDGATGILQAYVLDGEMENFIRIAAPTLEITATVGDLAQPLILKAVANPATGETVGDTSLFEVQSDWLKTASEFNGVVKTISVKGNTFNNVPFNFPKGNDQG